MLKTPHIRLTKTHKDKIVTKLIGDRFQKRRDALTEKQKEFADWLYERWYAPIAVKIKASGIPSDWFTERSQFYYATNNGKRYLANMSTTCLLPVSIGWGNCRVLDAVELEKLSTIGDTARINIEENNLKQELYSALSKFTTYKQLVESWPQIKVEVDSVIRPQDYVEKVSTVPALNYVELTNKIRVAA